MIQKLFSGFHVKSMEKSDTFPCPAPNVMFPDTGKSRLNEKL